MNSTRGDRSHTNICREAWNIPFTAIIHLIKSQSRIRYCRPHPPLRNQKVMQGVGQSFNKEILQIYEDIQANPGQICWADVVQENFDLLPGGLRRSVSPIVKSQADFLLNLRNQMLPDRGLTFFLDFIKAENELMLLPDISKFCEIEHYRPLERTENQQRIKIVSLNTTSMKCNTR